MKLLKLKIENIATYVDQNINFMEFNYPVFVTGRTGAGKTTLFIDAITAALFGSAYGRKEREYGKILVMRGKKSGKITLEFELGGKIYRVERFFSEREGSQARLFEINDNTPRLITNSVRLVDAKIREITGLTFDILINSAMVRQGDVYKFLKSTPSERRNILVEVLKINLDVLKEKAREKCKIMEERVKGLEDQIKILIKYVSRKQGIIEEIKNISKEIPKLQEKYKELDELTGRIRSKIDELDKKLMELREKLVKLEEMERQHNELEKEHNEIIKRLNNIRFIIDKYGKEVIINVHQFSKILNEYKLQKSELKRIEEGLSQAKKLLDQKKKLDNLIKRKLELERETSGLDKKEEEYEKLEQTIAQHESRKKEIEKHLSELRSAVAICPVCGSRLTEEVKKSRMSILQKELESIERELHRYAEQSEILKKEIGMLRRKKDELTRIEGQIKSLSEVLGEENAEKRYRDMLDRYEQENAKFGALRRKVGDVMGKLMVNNESELENLLGELSKYYVDVVNYDELKSRAAELKSKMKEYELELERKKKLNETYDFIESRKNKLNEELKKHEEEQEQIRGEIYKKEQRLQDLRETLKDIEEKEKEIKELKEKKSSLELDIQAYSILEKQVFSVGALPTKLLKEYLRIIERYTNDYLSRVFHQDIEVQFQFKRSRETQQSVELKSYAGGYERKIETFSGGEQTLIGFAIRLAIGKLLSQIFSKNRRPRFLIIDEGFGPLDEELRLTVAEALRNLKESNEFEQIIVISHQQELRYKPIFRTVIEIEKDSRNISRVKEISSIY